MPDKKNAEKETALPSAHPPRQPLASEPNPGYKPLGEIIAKPQPVVQPEINRKYGTYQSRMDAAARKESSHRKSKYFLYTSVAAIIISLAVLAYFRFFPGEPVPFNRYDGSPDYAYIEAQKMTELAERHTITTYRSGLVTKRRNSYAFYYLLQSADGTFFTAEMTRRKAEKFNSIRVSDMSQETGTSAILYGHGVPLPGNIADLYTSGRNTIGAGNINDIFTRNYRPSEQLFENNAALASAWGEIMLYEGWSRNGRQFVRIFFILIAFLVIAAVSSGVAFMSTKPVKKDGMSRFI